jgi:hypothetical protein
MSRILRTLVAPFLSFVCIASASAAPPHRSMPVSRYMAIEACSQQARDERPSTGSPRVDGRARSFVYAACMHDKGFLP